MAKGRGVASGRKPTAPATKARASGKGQAEAAGKKKPLFEDNSDDEEVVAKKTYGKRKEPAPAPSESSEESSADEYSDDSDEAMSESEGSYSELDEFSAGLEDSDNSDSDGTPEEDEEEETKGRAKRKFLKKAKQTADESSSYEFTEDSDSDRPLTEFERRAARRVKAAERVAAESALELAEGAEDIPDLDIAFPAPEAQDGEEEGEEGEEGASKNEPLMDLHAVQQRLQDVSKVLSDFARLRDPSRSRADYMKLLVRDVCTIYDYSSWLAGKILELFSVAEALEFFEANEAPRPFTIRANTLKTRRRDLMRALSARGVNLEPIDSWSSDGLQVFDSTVPIGATPEYLAGHYMLQSAASFLPVLALDPQPGERVLDMCAAPGGKTTHLAQLMKNTGLLWANDKNRERLPALVANMHRLGVTNMVVTNYDGLDFPRVMGGFQRILLDAPCTGLGVLSKDPAAKTQRSADDVKRLSLVQRELLLAAIDSLDPDGTVVYSTCSIMVEENEAVVDYALRKRHVHVVPTGLAFGTPGFVRFRDKRFHPSLKDALRVYPHTHNMDGFFVCRLVKTAPGERKPAGFDETEWTEMQRRKEAGKARERDQQRAKRERRARRSGLDKMRAIERDRIANPVDSSKFATTAAAESARRAPHHVLQADAPGRHADRAVVSSSVTDFSAPPSKRPKKHLD